MDNGIDEQISKTIEVLNIIKYGTLRYNNKNEMISRESMIMDLQIALNDLKILYDNLAREYNKDYAVFPLSCKEEYYILYRYAILTHDKLDYVVFEMNFDRKLIVKMSLKNITIYDETDQFADYYIFDGSFESFKIVTGNCKEEYNQRILKEKE